MAGRAAFGACESLGAIASAQGSADGKALKMKLSAGGEGGSVLAKLKAKQAEDSFREFGSVSLFACHRGLAFCVR